MRWNKNNTGDLVIDFGYLMTPLDKCIQVETGNIDQTVLYELEEGSYDYGVVTFKGNGNIGCVSTVRLGELYLSEQVLNPDSSDIIYNKIDNVITVFELLEYFTTRDITVISDLSATDIDLGIVTLSDLNRSYLRSVIYLYLSELELLLESHIKKNFDDVQMWIDHLPEESQVKIWGNYYVSKRKNIELDPIEFCGLEELFRIIYSREIREFFQKKNNSPFVNLYKMNIKYSEITSLREIVVHPIRPLILNRDDVIELNRIMIIVKNIIDVLK